jgi:hypothetical protein
MLNSWTLEKIIIFNLCDTEVVIWIILVLLKRADGLKHRLDIREYTRPSYDINIRQYTRPSYDIDIRQYTRPSYDINIRVYKAIVWYEY